VYISVVHSETTFSQGPHAHTDVCTFVRSEYAIGDTVKLKSVNVFAYHIMLYPQQHNVR